MQDIYVVGMFTPPADPGLEPRLLKLVQRRQFDPAIENCYFSQEEAEEEIIRLSKKCNSLEEKIILLKVVPYHVEEKVIVE